MLACQVRAGARMGRWRAVVRFASTEPPIMTQIRQQLKEAMRSGNGTTKNTLRAIMAAVKNANIDKPGSLVTDVAFYGLLESLAAKRGKSLDEYMKGGREDLAKVERAEIAILDALRKQIPLASDEQLDSRVKELLEKLGLANQQNVQLKQVVSQVKWPEVEASWGATRKSVVAAIKRSLGTRSFSTSSYARSHENPLGVPRRKGAGTAPVGKRKIPGLKKVIAVSSAKGGVGKSTVATNLALAVYERGYSVGVLDADIFGPSVPTMLGLSGEPRLTSEGKLVPMSNFGVKAMSMGLLVPPGKAVAWRGLLVQKALQQLFFDVDWGDLDYLIVDMPPGTGDVQLTMTQQVHLDGAIIVSTPQDIALIDAARGADMFKTVKTPILGLVQNMSVFVCPNCHSETHIFGHDGAIEEAKKLQIPLLASIPLSMDVAKAGDAGRPVAVGPPTAAKESYLQLADAVIKS